jgi:hypothetical protein
MKASFATKTTVFVAILGSIILAALAPADAAAAGKRPPKPKRACPPGQMWVFESKFLNEPAHWACVPRNQPPPK